MSTKTNTKLVIKIVFTGPAGAGKTALSGVITHTGDPDYPNITVSGSCASIVYERDGYSIEVELWDTAGSERYRALNGMYYRNARGVITVYDISDAKSFPIMKEYVTECVNETEADNPDDLIVVVVGNKCDLSRVRQVSKEEGEEFARSRNYFFLETSAKMNINVDEIMDKIIDKMLENPERYIAETQKTVIDPVPSSPDPKKCC